MPPDNTREEDVVSPEKEFEADVLSQFGFEGSEPIPSDNEGEGEADYGTQDEAYDGDAEQADRGEYEQSESDNQADVEAQSQTEAQVTQDNQENFNVKSDQKGNLIDANGKIVARAGSERRLYEKAEKATRNFNDIREKFEEHLGLMKQASEMIGGMKQRISELENGGKQAQYQINDAEAEEAFKVYNMLKNDATALDGAKYVLTKLHERGINIKSLGATDAALDPRVLAQSITGQIDERLKPITSQYEAQAQEKQRQEAAAKTVDDFYNRYPAARQYGQTLAAMKRDPRFSGMSLDEAWSRLQVHLANERVKQLEQGQSQPQPAPAPMPRGVPRPAAPQGPRRSVDNSPVNADMAFRDIVSGVLQDYGSDFE